MKKIFIWSLVFVVGVSLIGMFGCRSRQEDDDHTRFTLADIRRMANVKGPDDFTYCIKERKAGYKKYYYTDEEPIKEPGRIIIKNAYTEENSDMYKARSPIEVSAPYTILERATDRNVIKKISDYTYQVIERCPDDTDYLRTYYTTYYTNKKPIENTNGIIIKEACTRHRRYIYTDNIQYSTIKITPPYTPLKVIE